MVLHPYTDVVSVSVTRLDLFWLWKACALSGSDDDDELMLNVLRCHLTY